MGIARALLIALAVLVVAGTVEGCASTAPKAAHHKKNRVKRTRGADAARATALDDGTLADGDAGGQRLSQALEDGELELTDAVDEGLVSYYHDSLAGNATANGERYRLAGATCAHKTLPFGTIVVIEDTETGKLATCRVNDRGPFVKGRVLDVSKRVARDLGLLDRGVIRARLRLILPAAA
ncbi:MAG: septal ring lytic transglycosylase RlpA family protein [Deltaproteobacteria bacterium]|nr:septal ring lytic transglycosylase RlpA family protein [Deltaproteobacteria bacterium]